MLRDIPGYNGDYAADESGNIYSRKRGGTRLLSPVTNKHGYLQLGLFKNRKAKTMLVHRLVGAAFYGWRDGLHINHKNGIRSDNRVTNLEWLTPIENQRHSWRALDRKPLKYWLDKKGSDHGCSAPVLAKRSDGSGEWFPGVSDAARCIGGVASHITKCCYGKRRSHKGFEWTHCPWPEKAK